jgi:hypothetical protein
MADHSVLRDKVRLYFETRGGDVVHASELYHDDAVLEFPQSGERFVGRAEFTEWRSRYPAVVDYQLQRVTVRDDLVVVELTANYGGGSTMYGVALLEFRDDKIAWERIYVMEGWQAPEWRARWRSDTAASSD